MFCVYPLEEKYNFIRYYSFINFCTRTLSIYPFCLYLFKNTIFVRKTFLVSLPCPFSKGYKKRGEKVPKTAPFLGKGMDTRFLFCIILKIYKIINSLFVTNRRKFMESSLLFYRPSIMLKLFFKDTKLEYFVFL